jgi:hypothetical protein
VGVVWGMGCVCFVVLMLTLSTTFVVLMLAYKYHKYVAAWFVVLMLTISTTAVVVLNVGI